MINRNKLRLAEILIVSGLITSLIAKLTDFKLLYILAIVLMGAGFILNLIICHCPHCKYPIRRLSSLSRDPGYCKYCGKQILFDE